MRTWLRCWCCGVLWVLSMSLPARGLVIRAASNEQRDAQAGEGAWRTVNLPFRPLGLTSVGNRLWVCGTQESLFVSSDGGANWEAKHKKADGGLLLNVEFANEKFGYAAGSGGLLLMTEDGGESWKPVAGISETILQVSFADPTHGLVRTRSSLLYTVDGKQWSEISAANLQGEDAKTFKEFQYTFALIALDDMRMAAMLKLDGAQYYDQRFLVTVDGGRAWKLVELPSVTLKSFLEVNGKYQAVGTEVIHKEDKGGGYAVAAAFVSTDGQKWEHTSGDISLCKPDLCGICRVEGCMIENGAMARIFLDKPTLAVFAVTKDFTPKWAATEGHICFVASDLKCAVMKENAASFNKDVPPLPPVMTPPALGAKASAPPVCISCSLDRIIVDQKIKGNYTIGLVLLIGQDGTVSNVEVNDAPSAEIKDRLKGQIEGWLFEPVVRDGRPVLMKVKTSTQIVVIKSK